MKESGFIQAGPVLEKYLTMPTPETKPEEQRSEIWIPYQKIQRSDKFDTFLHSYLWWESNS